MFFWSSAADLGLSIEQGREMHFRKSGLKYKRT